MSPAVRPRRRIWRLVLVAAAFWFAAGGGRAWCQEISDEAREALARANAAVRQQQWLLAEQQYKIAYDKSSKAPEVLLALAQFNERRSGRDLIAAVWYRAYLAARPDAGDRDEIKAKIDALEQRAISLANGFIERALSATSNVASSDRFGVLTNVATAQAQLGNVSGAFSTASNARALNSNSWADDPFGQVAKTLAAQGDLAGTEDALRRVETSKRSAALVGVVSTLSFAKRPRDAMAFAAATSGSDRVNAYSYIARALSDLGDRSGARSNLDIAIYAANGLDKTGRGYRLGLVTTASEIGEFDTARRIYSDASKLFNAADKYDVSSLNSAKWELAKGLANRGRLAEAEALYPSVFANDPDHSHAWYRSSLRQTIQGARVKQAEELIKQGKLPEAEAALTKEPWISAYAEARLKIAQAHIAKNDMSAARRLLDLAAASAAKTGIGESGDNSFGYTLLRVYLSDAYMKLNDLAASRRILDATAGTISRLTKPDDKKYPLEYLAKDYADLAKAYAATKNYPNARGAAAEALKLVNQMTSNDDRASVLSSLSDLDPQVGLVNELAAALPSLPSGSTQQGIVKSLVRAYASGNQDAQALAMAARINDVSDRKSVLSSIVSGRLDAKNWSGALALANEPGTSGLLYAEIAYKMLSADMRNDAAALEPKFTAGSREADSYFSYLATRQVSAGDFEGALKTALRITAIPERVRSLFSLASSVDGVLGHAAAKPIADRAIGQFADIKAPADRAETCNSLTYSYLGYGTVFADDLPPNGARAEDGPLALACAAEALEVPDQSTRISRLQTALSNAKLSTRPVMGKAMLPLRQAISRAIGEMQGNSNYGYSSMADVAAKLVQDGAIESALDLAGFPAAAYSHYAGKAAAAWLADVDATADAQRILAQYAPTIVTAKDDSERDSRSSAAADIAIAAGDLEAALKYASDIKSESSRISELVDVARAAVNRKRFEVALNALERAKAAAAAGGRNYYLSSMASLAAQAGDKNAEFYVAEIAKGGKLGEEVDARNTLLTELVKWKQLERASALLPVQEAALAKLPASDRASYRGYWFAGHLAALGDTARLDRLIASVPLPENKIYLLFSAASSFNQAGHPEAAQVAVGRVLEISGTMASPATRVSHLQSAASYYRTGGKLDAARTALARSVELVGQIPEPGTRATYLRQAAGGYAALGDVDKARALLTRSLEELKTTRPDAAAWMDYTLATALNASDPEQAVRIASAIADPFWRARAVQALVNARISANKLPEALTLLKSVQPSPLLDQDVMKVIRTQLGKRELDSVRMLIGKIANAWLRDQARRQMVLVQAHQGSIEAALADIGTIEDKATRAYTLVDLGWFLSARTDDRSSAQYFSQLVFFVAAKLAEQVPDLQTKVDVLAAVSHGQRASDADLGAAALARAETLATEIPDERARRYAVRWAKPLPAEARGGGVNSEELSHWTYRAGSGLDSEQYKDPESFIQSLAAKNPGERANSLAQAAGNVGSQIREIHAKADEFARSRQAAAH